MRGCWPPHSHTHIHAFRHTHTVMLSLLSLQALLTAFSYIFYWQKGYVYTRRTYSHTLSSRDLQLYSHRLLKVSTLNLHIHNLYLNIIFPQTHSIRALLTLFIFSTWTPFLLSLHIFSTQTLHRNSPRLQEITCHSHSTHIIHYTLGSHTLLSLYPLTLH